MEKFICTKKCFHNGTLYLIGRPGKFTKAEDGPQSHKDDEGKTHLIHFVEVGGDEPVPAIPKGKVKVKVNNEERE